MEVSPTQPCNPEVGSERCTALFSTPQLCRIDKALTDALSIPNTFVWLLHSTLQMGSLLGESKVITFKMPFVAH